MAHIVTRIFRRFASLIYTPIIWHVKGSELPFELQPAINFLATGDLDAETSAVASRIEHMRTGFSKSGDSVIKEIDLPDEVPFWRGKIQSGARQLAVMGKKRKWGIVLFLLARSAHSGMMLELGTGIGFSGCYLASSPHHRYLISIEGSKLRAEIARRNLALITNKALVYDCLFDDALDLILPKYKDFDFVFIDGHKNKEALLHYWNRIIPNLDSSALVVFDDIYWSMEMREAWEILRQHKGFSYTVDLGILGVCKWVGGDVVPKQYFL